MVGGIRSRTVKRTIVLLAILVWGACTAPTESGDPLQNVQPVAPTTQETADEFDLPTPEPSVTPYPFEGYPRLVPLSEVPENMRWSFDSADAVAVAPGVWAENAPGASVMDSALHGGWNGYCASIEVAERALNRQAGGMCW